MLQLAASAISEQSILPGKIPSIAKFVSRILRENSFNSVLTGDMILLTFTTPQFRMLQESGPDAKGIHNAHRKFVEGTPQVSYLSVFY